MRIFGFSSIILQAAFRRILRTKPVVFNPVNDFNFLCNVVRLVAISSTNCGTSKPGSSKWRFTQATASCKNFSSSEGIKIWWNSWYSLRFYPLHRIHLFPSNPLFIGCIRWRALPEIMHCAKVPWRRFLYILCIVFTACKDCLLYTSPSPRDTR